MVASVVASQPRFAASFQAAGFARGRASGRAGVMGVERGAWSVDGACAVTDAQFLRIYAERTGGWRRVFQRMKHNDPVSRIMSTSVVTVHSGEPLSKVRKIMNETGFHHVPVVSGLELVGLISWSDILRLSFSDAFNTDERAVDATLDHSLTLEQVMARDPITIPEDGKIREAAEILAKGGFHSLPVVSGRRLVGMITTTDLIKYLRDQF